MVLTTRVFPASTCLFILFSFVAHALTQSTSNDTQDLVELLRTTPSLSVWYGLVSNHSDIETLYSSFENTTCFAVTDSANNAFYETQAAPLMYEASVVPAFLQYMCVHGVIETESFTTDRLLMRTYLNDSAHTNVTGGQTLEGLLENGTSFLLSGLNIDSIASAFLPLGSYVASDYILQYPALRQKSRIMESIPFTGGLLHIIDSIATPVYSVFLTSYLSNLTALEDAVSTEPNEVVALDNQSDLTLIVLSDAAYQVYNSSNISATAKAAIHDDNSFAGTVLTIDMFTSEGTNVTTQSGRNVTLTNVDGQLLMNNVSVVEPHIPVDNGAMYLTEGYSSFFYTLLALVLTLSSNRYLFPIPGVPKIVVDVVTVTASIRMLYGMYRTYTLQGEFTLGPSTASSVEASLATQPVFVGSPGGSDQP